VCVVDTGGAAWVGGRGLVSSRAATTMCTHAATHLLGAKASRLGCRHNSRPLRHLQASGTTHPAVDVTGWRAAWLWCMVRGGRRGAHAPATACTQPHKMHQKAPTLCSSAAWRWPAAPPTARRPIRCCMTPGVCSASVWVCAGGTGGPTADGGNGGVQRETGTPGTAIKLRMLVTAVV
jgi:hypothetical protein